MHASAAAPSHLACTQRGLRGSRRVYQANVLETGDDIRPFVLRQGHVALGQELACQLGMISVLSLLVEPLRKRRLELLELDKLRLRVLDVYRVRERVGPLRASLALHRPFAQHEVPVK